ncbi:hypothetical protein V2J74_03330 [Pseudomonas alliivorans]|nr:hypothetical protein [Pseudomonas alliivorans]
MMDNMPNVVPIFALACAVAALLFNMARATPEELEKVKGWVLELMLVVIACTAIFWFGYKCILFTISTAPISRGEVTSFALALVNVLMYASVLSKYLRQRSRRTALIAQRQLQGEKDRLCEELAEAREERLAAEIKRDTLEQISNFAHRMIHGNISDKDKPDKKNT